MNAREEGNLSSLQGPNRNIFEFSRKPIAGGENLSSNPRNDEMVPIAISRDRQNQNKSVGSGIGVSKTNKEGGKNNIFNTNLMSDNLYCNLVDSNQSYIRGRLDFGGIRQECPKSNFLAIRKYKTPAKEEISRNDQLY